MPSGIARLRTGLVLAVMLATACATSTRPPATAATGELSSAIAPAEQAEEDGELEDEDGEVEATSEPAAQADAPSPCPENMVLVDDAVGPKGEPLRFCIDKYEASLVEVGPDGVERPYPHYLPVDGHTVRAVSVPGVFPQAFISEVQAEEACAASGKRLCSHVEWKTACMGPSKTTFPYGDTRQAGVCHDKGRSAVAAVFGFHRLADPVATSPRKATASTKATSDRAAKTARPAHVVKGKAAETTRARPTRTAAKSEPASKKRPRSSRTDDKAVAAKGASKKGAAAKPTKARSSTAKRTPAKASTRPVSVEPSVWTQLNDPRLGQVEGAVARTGSHEACVSGYGAVDMVGNLHEWVKTDPSLPHGTFAGGYFLDTTINGEGCNYRTTAHAHDYHDYSTGFRCCADASE